MHPNESEANVRPNESEANVRPNKNEVNVRLNEILIVLSYTRLKLSSPIIERNELELTNHSARNNSNIL